MVEQQIKGDGRGESIKPSWIAGSTSFLFILLQSVCTAVLTISGVRLLIGAGALASAAGWLVPFQRLHVNTIRIPMMLLALAGSLINLFVVQRIRSLRAKPSAKWRATPVTPEKMRTESIQIFLAILTLALVLTEFIAHRIVQGRF